MRHDIQVLDRIRKTYASLRPSEQRVADYVLNHPETCTQQTISELADQVQVSQPTVVRFVQALGFGGFRNFKYCLLRDRSQGTEREAYFDHLSETSNTACCGTAARGRSGRPTSTTWGALT